MPGSSNGALHDVHCKGCGRLVGRTSANRSLPIFCPDPVCPLVPPAGENDDRNGVLETLLAEGETPGDVGELLGISRQRVLQLSGRTP